MNDITQQTKSQTGTSEYKQSDKNFDNDDWAMHQSTVIAGTSEGLVFLESKQDSKQQVELEGKPITALAANADELWVIVDHRSIWHRNAAKQWHQVASADDVRFNCILPIAETVLVGTSEAHLLRITDGNVERLNCFDQMQDREKWYTPWGGPPDVRSMAVGQSGELYVGLAEKVKIRGQKREGRDDRELGHDGNSFHQNGL
jgi:hypothetical protein